ncbi:DUF305 domain-containing protein [Schumannella sp. 10F1B-5-1]|nr:DUF305 domain-containing protein [Schumannella sp. 10F1B-5-1]TPW71821.1 DUF305 domain-containing protein [Schumannella sp. 10F1B-5-1]
MRIRTTALLAAGALSTALVLAGCSQSGSMSGMDHGSEPSSSASASAYNDADVMFAQMMLAHHEQAIEMSDMLLAKDGIDERVVAMAQKIKKAQAPEISTMKSWLTAWGQSVDSDMAGMGHGDGMMSEQDMADLEAASGSVAAKLFLDQMVQHHEGAVTMAKSEVSDGENSDAVALAKSIVTSQTDEIATMKALSAEF